MQNHKIIDEAEQNLSETLSASFLPEEMKTAVETLIQVRLNWVQPTMD